VQIAKTVRDLIAKGMPPVHRSKPVDLYRSQHRRARDIETMESSRDAAPGGRQQSEKITSEVAGTRGRVWFKALTGQESSLPGDPRSVLTADAQIGNDDARFLCVFPDPHGRFPRARHGEVGLEETYTLAARVREVIDADKVGEKRPIVAIVDVKSQAYGKREEIAGIHLAAAAAADAYATARFAGHPVIALIVGQAISGGFLAHGYQANRLLALDNDGVLIHAMRKEAAARITRHTLAELEELAKTVISLSYDARDYAKLGLLYKLLRVSNAGNPTAADVPLVRSELSAAVQDSRKGSRDLRHRIESEAAQIARMASRLVRARIEQQW
jgi:malonate decarboxylase gamma subunit